ncbi:MAG TPA: hypothetical protein EYM91_01350 [Acidobacteria bacterium]|nr:hypothetical protein [Acidobacteriota bacterium]
MGKKVVAQGKGCSKKEAEQHSAAYALEQLRSGGG